MGSNDCFKMGFIHKQDHYLTHIYIIQIQLTVVAIAVAVGGGGGGHDRIQLRVAYIPRNHARAVDRHARTSLLSHKHNRHRVGMGRLE